MAEAVNGVSIGHPEILAVISRTRDAKARSVGVPPDARGSTINKKARSKSLTSKRYAYSVYVSLIVQRRENASINYVLL